ncbi:MAG: hypothetical protein Q8M22_04125 [Actinomycetota bacterium]|nr:hypothetical protein [Actinomycetota bacterium]
MTSVGDCFEAFGSDWAVTRPARTVCSLVEVGDRGVDVHQRVAGPVDREAFEGEADIDRAVVDERDGLVLSILEARRVFCPSREEFGSNCVDVDRGEFTGRVRVGDERVRGE